MAEEHLFFHIDVNSAFLSWSALKLLREGGKTDIRTIPSIVGGDRSTRHGIVLAKSIPAKAYGIHTADTVADACRKCPDLVSVPPDHEYYREMSRKLMAYLARICPDIEQVSIDECYMNADPLIEEWKAERDLPRIRGEAESRTDIHDAAVGIATEIKDGIRSTFGFTVNVGVSDRKILAKMASDFRKPDLVHTLFAAEIQEKMWPLPIEKLHMCGRSSAAKLRNYGIRTIGDLARTDPALPASWLKSHGRLLWQYANGIDDSAVQSEPSRTKGIGNSTTLEQDAVTAEQAYAVLDELAASVARRLRRHGLLASQVTVEIRYADFRKASHQMPLRIPTDQREDIQRAACRLFDESWEGAPVRLLGIRTGKLTDSEAPVQISLFDYQKEHEQEAARREKKAQEEREEQARREQQAALKEKHGRAEAAMEQIQKRFGRNAVHRGAGPVMPGHESHQE